MANKPFDNLLKYGPAALAAMDLRVILVMSNTTLDPVTLEDFDAATVGDIATLDECDASNYVSGGVAFTGESSSLDHTAHAGRATASPVTFDDLDAGTRSNVAAIVVRWDTDLATSEPLGWFDDVTGTPTFPFNGNGTDVVFTPHLDGLFEYKAA